MNTQKQINNYIARQNAWLKANDIKKGDTILIAKSHESYSKGWCCSWVKNMNDHILTLSQFKFDYQECGVKLKTEYIYPYTVLHKLEGKPDEYKFVKFIHAYNTNEEHIALIHKIDQVKNEGDFILQNSIIDDIPFLRKINSNDFIKSTYSKEWINYEKKGYYPADTQDFFQKMPKVVATTLPGLGLPILQYPNND